ncbi:unnamed protein product [Anisakis simplex]|uniref:Uncharacterized protein n=1 Tax=Anisakis simplex TaxID=6269 RepID=A0A0M3J476_ANISI|nr:unnamed protein product [Anisakis simplex]
MLSSLPLRNPCQVVVEEGASGGSGGVIFIELLSSNSLAPLPLPADEERFSDDECLRDEDGKGTGLGPAGNERRSTETGLVF